MLRFINASIFIGLAQEAVLGYIKEGKQVPQTLDEVETLLLTVMSKNEFKRLDKIPGLDAAMEQIMLWIITDELTRDWFADCDVGRMYEEARYRTAFS